MKAFLQSLLQEVNTQRPGPKPWALCCLRAKPSFPKKQELTRSLLKTHRREMMR